MKSSLLKIQWESYRKEVVPPGAPPTQIQETRRSFYAGARIMLSLIKRIDVTDEDRAVQELEALEQELLDFLSKIGKDY